MPLQLASSRTRPGAARPRPQAHRRLSPGAARLHGASVTSS